MTMKYEGEKKHNNDEERSNEGSFKSLLTCELTGG